MESTREGLQIVVRQLGLNDADIRYKIGAVLNVSSILETANHCYFKYLARTTAAVAYRTMLPLPALFNESGAIATDIYGNAMELNRDNNMFMSHRGLLFTIQKQLAYQYIFLNKKSTASRQHLIDASCNAVKAIVQDVCCTMANLSSS